MKIFFMINIVFFVFFSFLENIYSQHDHEGHEAYRKKEDHKEPAHDKHSSSKKQKVGDKKKFHDDDDDHKGDNHSVHEGQHSSQGSEDHEDIVRLSDKDIKDFNIQVELAKSGSIQNYISLMGEVVANANQEARIAPRFTGLVTKVLKEQGDYVQQGETMALVEANDSLNTYELKSLIEGTVLKKNITIGEVHGDSSVAFVVANLDTVWVNLNVYQKDLTSVKKGSEVVILTEQELPNVKGIVFYVSPIIAEETRTAIARVEVDNKKGLFRPGMFVEAQVFGGQERADIVIPKKALQIVEGRLSVFIQYEEGFKPVPVKIGHQNEEYVEIISGLDIKQKYVSNGAFILKADLSKAAFGDGHNH